MKLTLTILLVLTAVSISASPLVCPPDFVHDNVPVNPSCAGLGATIFATPNTDYILSWNDNFGNVAPGPTGTYDFNDLVASVDFDAAGTSVTIAWLSAISADDNALYDGTLFLFSNTDHPSAVTLATVPGQSIPFDLNNGLGQGLFYTGVGTNADGAIHDWASETTAAPEPSYAGIIAIIAICGLVGKKQRLLLTFGRSK